MSIRVYKTTLKNTHLGVYIEKPKTPVWGLSTQFIIEVEKTPATNSIASSNTIALAVFILSQTIPIIVIFVLC